MSNVIVTAAQARTVAQLDELTYESPEPTLDGVTCGLCTSTARRLGDPAVKHASVEHVRYCYTQHTDWAAEAAAEQAAELAVERWFEERGGEYDPRERELWAREDFFAGR